MVDPDIELRGGGGEGGREDVLSALTAFLPSMIFFLFNLKEGGPGPPGHYMRSSTAVILPNELYINVTSLLSQTLLLAQRMGIVHHFVF